MPTNLQKYRHTATATHTIASTTSVVAMAAGKDDGSVLLMNTIGKIIITAN